MIDRILKKTSVSQSWCIEYQWHTDSDWYGKCKIKGKWYKTHRVVYQYFHPEIILTPEIFVCHKCDNPKCCNIDHLFLWSHQDNMDDMKRKGRNRINTYRHYWNNFWWKKIKIWDLIFESYRSAWIHFWISDNWVKKRFKWKIQIL